MLLIDTNNDFQTYLKSLSKHARKDYSYVQKHNQDLTYEKVDFDLELVRRFMGIWETQLIRGKTVTWAFPVEHIADLATRGELLLFRAIRDHEPLAVHFVQLRSGYIECHPPMYDKVHSKRYLAKYMWFNLIKYCMEHNLGPLDMGGGPKSWREHIVRRAEFPNPQYKWIYVPEHVKQHPELQRNYYIDEGSLREIN